MASGVHHRGCGGKGERFHMVCADLCGHRCPDCSWACRRESIPPESDVDYLTMQRALAGDRKAIAYIKKMRRLVPAFPYENPRSREKIEAEALYRLNDAARLLKTHPAASAEDAAEAGGLLQALTGDERSAFYSHYPHSWNFLGLKGVEARTPLVEGVMGEFQRSNARQVLGLTTLMQFNPAACGEERFTRAHGHEVCGAAKGHKKGQDRWTPMQDNPHSAKHIEAEIMEAAKNALGYGREERRGGTGLPISAGEKEWWSRAVGTFNALLEKERVAFFRRFPAVAKYLGDRYFLFGQLEAREAARKQAWHEYSKGLKVRASERKENPATMNRAANARAMWAYNIGKLTHTNPGLWAGVAEAENPLSTQEIEGINHLAFSHAQSAVGWGPERGIRGRQKQRTEGGLGVLAARRELQGLQGEANPQFADQAAQAINLIDRAAGEAGDRAYGLFAQAADAITSLPAATEVRDELDARFRSAAKQQMDRGVLGHGRFAELTNRIQAENNPAKPRAFYSARRKADWHRSRGRRARVLAVAGGKYDVFLDGRRETRARITITRGRKARVSTLRDTETSLPLITVEAPVDIKRSDIEQAAQAAAAALPDDATNEDLAKEMGQALADIIADIPEPAPA